MLRVKDRWILWHRSAQIICTKDDYLRYSRTERGIACYNTGESLGRYMLKTLWATVRQGKVEGDQCYN
jgi:hypothetical protein